MMHRSHKMVRYAWLTGVIFCPMLGVAQNVVPMVPPTPSPTATFATPVSPAPAPSIAAANSTNNGVIVPSNAVPPSNPNGAAGVAPTTSAGLPAGAPPRAPAVSPVANAPAAPVLNQDYSYGSAPYSVFYTPDQIEQMKSLLKSAEINLAKGGGDVAVVTPILVQIPEPVTYPIFYLSSIVYHGPTDWTIWLEQTGGQPGAPIVAPAPQGAPGAPAPIVPVAPVAAATATPGKDDMKMIKLTPRSNAGEISVVSIGPDNVQFSWKPSYMAAIETRSKKHLFADTAPVVHRLAKTSHIDYTPGVKDVLFSLRENQSFVAAYFACFEGRVPNTTLAAIAPPPPPPGTVNAAAGDVPPAPAPSTGNEDENIDTLLARSSKQQAQQSGPVAYGSIPH